MWVGSLYHALDALTRVGLTIIEDDGRVYGPIWTGRRQNLLPTPVQTLDRPVRREFLRPSTFLANKYLFWEVKSSGMRHWITGFAFTDIITALRSFETSWHAQKTIILNKTARGKLKLTICILLQEKTNCTTVLQAVLQAN